MACMLTKTLSIQAALWYALAYGLHLHCSGQCQDIAPSCTRMQASHWQQYAQLELRARNMPKVKSVFSRCLLNCYSIPLWTAYLDFIKQVLLRLSPARWPSTASAWLPIGLPYCLVKASEDRVPGCSSMTPAIYEAIH